MGVANPDIFNITVRARDRYSAARESGLEVEVGMQYSAKVLHYILHIILSDHHLHHPRTANLPIDDATQIARLNFSRLLRQVDVNNLLPQTLVDIVRQIYLLGPFPMPEAMRLQWPRLPSLRQSLEAVLRDHQTDFILYESNFGVNEIVSWPTFSVVLPSLTSSAAVAIIEDIHVRFDPFSDTRCCSSSRRRPVYCCRSDIVLSQGTYCRVDLRSQSLRRTPSRDVRLLRREFLKWRYPRPDRWARALWIRRWSRLCPCA